MMTSTKVHGFDVITHRTSYDRTFTAVINSTRANEKTARALAREYGRIEGGTVNNFRQMPPYSWHTWQHEPVWAFDVTLK